MKWWMKLKIFGPLTLRTRVLAYTAGFVVVVLVLLSLAVFNHQSAAILVKDVSTVVPADSTIVPPDKSHGNCRGTRTCYVIRTWVRNSPTRDVSTCDVARKAAKSAHRSAQLDSAVPGIACSYFVILTSFLRPDLGKVSLTVSVLKDSPNSIIVKAQDGP